MSMFIELTQNQINKLTNDGLLHTIDGIMKAKLHKDCDAVPVKLKGTPDPEINFKSDLVDGFKQSAAIIRQCRDKALYHA